MASCLTLVPPTPTTTFSSPSTVRYFFIDGMDHHALTLSFSELFLLLTSSTSCFLFRYHVWCSRAKPGLDLPGPQGLDLQRRHQRSLRHGDRLAQGRRDHFLLAESTRWGGRARRDDPVSGRSAPTGELRRRPRAAQDLPHDEERQRWQDADRCRSLHWCALLFMNFLAHIFRFLF